MLNISADDKEFSPEKSRLVVSDNPIAFFIGGHGSGSDTWRAAVRVQHSAVAAAYGGTRKICWMKRYAGQLANDQFNCRLPDEIADACREYWVSIKRPLTTLIHGGIRPLNEALRQPLDPYVCLRTVRRFASVPSPARKPIDIDRAIFRENTEDNYAGVELEAVSNAKRQFLEVSKEYISKGSGNIRVPMTFGVGFASGGGTNDDTRSTRKMTYDICTTDRTRSKNQMQWMC